MDWLRVWRWKTHWQILFAIGAGIVVGLVFLRLDGEPTVGLELGDGVVVEAVDSAVHSGDAQTGDVLVGVGGQPVEPSAAADALDRAVTADRIGTQVELVFRRDGEEVRTRARVRIGEGSPRDLAILPFDFIAELFLRLLQMLIVPIIVTSLVTGVTSLGNVRTLGRLGLRTLVYYVTTSLLAILVGLVLVNLIAPGTSAGELPLQADVGREDLQQEEGLLGIFLRMVPRNVPAAFTDNGAILQVIFACILFGIFIARVGGESGALLTRFFQAAFQVVMRAARFVLLFIPIGVLALIVRVVGTSGLAQFEALLVFMLTVVLALAVHAGVTLPLILAVVGRINPLRWFQAVAPALMTAFSTSSSSITLPETLRSVQERGRVSNRTSSFVLPLGATINMDGTALYECVGVIFLAQHYAATQGFVLDFFTQATVVITALLVSIGAAGIPSAGLVMMTTILSALELPLEGVFLLLAVDRPLDMLRTSVNIWSDTTCTAVVARFEGETDIAGSLEAE